MKSCKRSLDGLGLFANVLDACFIRIVGLGTSNFTLRSYKVSPEQ